MGCNPLSCIQNPKPRKSSSWFQPLQFIQTEVHYFDEFFSVVQRKSFAISQKLKLLQFEKSLFYHSLGLPQLFREPDSATASISLVLFLVGSGNRIEFLESCPYLQVGEETEIFYCFKKYVELLHQNIVALTELKPFLQDYIDRAREIIRTLSHTADQEGFDLTQKLNLIAVMVHNCKILWQIPGFIENRLLCVKKDLMDVKNGLRMCVGMSCRFSIFHGRFLNASPVDTIRSVWDSPEDLKNDSC